MPINSIYRADALPLVASQEATDRDPTAAKGRRQKKEKQPEPPRTETRVEYPTAADTTRQPVDSETLANLLANAPNNRTPRDFLRATRRQENAIKEENRRKSDTKKLDKAA